MRTFLAVVVVALIFGGTLVIGGERLGAWDSPTPASHLAAAASAEPKKAARPARRAKRGRRKAARRQRRVTKAPAWVAQLNALCRSAEAQTAKVAPPLTIPGLRAYIRRMAALSRRWNRRATTGPLAAAARRHPRQVREIRQLFEEEGILIRSALEAANRRDIEEFGRLGPLMVMNGEEQSRLLVALGARDCALSSNVT
jgi:hypothetical protein